VYVACSCGFYEIPHPLHITRPPPHTLAQPLPKTTALPRILHTLHSLSIIKISKTAILFPCCGQFIVYAVVGDLGDGA